MLMPNGHRPFAREKFSMWPLNSKWLQVCFLKNVLVQNDFNTSLYQIKLTFYGWHLHTFFDIAAYFKMVTIFVLK